MNGTPLERWLVILVSGYLAWVIPYDIREYTSFLAKLNPGLHMFITLAAITLVCGVLTFVLSQTGQPNPLKLALTMIVPWLLISLVFDFGLDTYYRGWEPDVHAYSVGRVWHFIFVPVGCIIAGTIALFMNRKPEVVVSSLHNVPKYRR